MPSWRSENLSFEMANQGTVIVTGASKGIGAAIARQLDQRGFSVAGLSRSGKSAAGKAYQCDVTDEVRLVSVFTKIADEGVICGLVNNAGLHLTSPSAVLGTEEYQQVMRLNATAVMTASREIYPHLVTAGGKIINIGSFFDKMGVPDNLAYCASKAAVAAMTRCLAVEWASQGISVINVAPGYVETDLNRELLTKSKLRTWLGRRVPVGRPGTPKEVATLVAALFAEDLPFLTGETIYIDGGQGMNH